MSKLGELSVILTDISQEEYKKELIEYLKTYLKSIENERAMSDYQLVLEGQKSMLGDVIKFIENN